MPNFFQRPCRVVFVDDKPVVEIRADNHSYGQFQDVPKSVVDMFLITQTTAIVHKLSG